MRLNAHILAFAVLLLSVFFFVVCFAVSLDFLQPILHSTNNTGDADFFLLPFKDAFVSSVKRIIHFHRAFFFLLSLAPSSFFHVCRLRFFLVGLFVVSQTTIDNHSGYSWICIRIATRPYKIDSAKKKCPLKIQFVYRRIGTAKALKKDKKVELWKMTVSTYVKEGTVKL